MIAADNAVCDRQGASEAVALDAATELSRSVVDNGYIVQRQRDAVPVKDATAVRKPCITVPNSDALYSCGEIGYGKSNGLKNSIQRSAIDDGPVPSGARYRKSFRNVEIPGRGGVFEPARDCQQIGPLR